MAYPGLPRVPHGFTDLNAAWNHPLPNPGDKHTCDMIGVCVDFLPPSKSRGTDYTMKMTLHDPYFVDGIGMPFQLFFKDESWAPAVQNQGDIVIFRNAGTHHHVRLGRVAWTNFGSTWAVLEHESLSNSTTEDYSDVVIHRSLRNGQQAPVPNIEQIKYAKAILDLEDSTRWQVPAKPTALQVNNIMLANGGTSRAPISSQKARLVAELTIPSHDMVFVDLTVEVRRIYTTDRLMELSVTDYTENSSLYEYNNGSSENMRFDPGDCFGYVQSGVSHKAWPGPWGKRTLNVTLWEPHRQYAIANVKPGSLIQLKNVHLKQDTQGAKLEGACHGDRMFPDRVLVVTLKPYEGESNPTLRGLLQRKRAYEEHCKASGLRFIRDADPNKAQVTKGGQVDGTAALEEEPRDAKAKRNRKQKEKQRAKAAAAATAANHNATKKLNSKNAGKSEIVEVASTLAPNAHVRTVLSTQSTIRIDEILDPATRIQTTFAGNSWTAPFVNRRYKAKAKVVDFYPDRLEDFAVRVRRSEYADAGLSDAEDDEVDNDGDGSDGSSGQSKANDSDTMSIDGDNDGRRNSNWEWRFALIVEDPTPASRITKAGSEKVDKPSTDRQQLHLIVSGSQAEYLLRESACNLRKKPAELAKLREKMFVLWGDLEERREEMWEELGRAMEQGQANPDDMVQAAMRKVRHEYRSQPFECFIEEYGVLREKGLQGKRAVDWERCFRMTRTTIA